MANVTDTRELDLRGLKCPMPALRTSKVLREARVGQEIVVRCTDPLAAIDIPHLVSERGDDLIESIRDGDELIFRIRKTGASLLPG